MIFGYQYNHQPGFALDPKKVVNILMMTDKVAAATSFRVESLLAGGQAGEKPPVDPASVRKKPKDGVILGAGVKIPMDTQVAGSGVKVVVERDGQSVLAVFPPYKGEQSLTIKPPLGRWDLTLATEVHVKITNAGATPVAPGVEVTSNKGPTAVANSAPLAAGEAKEVIVSFIPTMAGIGAAVPKPGYYGNRPGTGTSFGSDAVSAVKITARHDGEAILRVNSITAAAPPAVLPDWLGKRPPVKGDWFKTLDEDFNKPTIDTKVWNIYGPNYWDRASHWSKDNLILEDGMAKFRFEKKRGFHNDNSDLKVDPHNLTGQKQSAYACGYLDSDGKWVQRYGYFEVAGEAAASAWPVADVLDDARPW